MATLKNTKILILKAKRLQRKIDALKPLYAELEAVTDQLRKAGFKAGHGLTLIDNFKNKNVAYRTTSIRRFELR